MPVECPVVEVVSHFEMTGHDDDVFVHVLAKLAVTGCVKRGVCSTGPHIPRWESVDDGRGLRAAIHDSHETSEHCDRVPGANECNVRASGYFVPHVDGKVPGSNGVCFGEVAYHHFLGRLGVAAHGA